MQAVCDPLKHLAAANLDIVKQELDSLQPRAPVYQKRVGNSNVYFLTPRPSIEAAVNEALLFQDAKEHPSTRSMLESLGQPIPSDINSKEAPILPSSTSEAAKEQPQLAGQRSASSGSKGKKGKKGKRKTR